MWAKELAYEVSDLEVSEAGMNLFEDRRKLLKES